MTLWAIVPVKPLRRAKSRLSGVLNRDERELLSQRMLIHTLDLLREVKEIERTLVVSRDSKALSIARKHGARTVAEHGTPELNNALVRATVVAQQYGISGVLVIPADLPLLRMEDIEKLINSAIDPPVVVIAPDRRGRGTNALLSSPPGLIEYDFGNDSFERHIARAKAAGVRLVVCEIPSIGLDVDLPEDLEYLQESLNIELIRDVEKGNS
ncbi:MAG TPA: 2-phospho-L-lactate guanylyltransferase [Anaerolineales bacterium]|nr:2-phospho-L-lactate guanylyltransferase [Anaerolineales bacterium]